MNKLSLIFSALLTVAFVLMMAPAVLAMNRGKALQNIALWLAIFAALGLIYQNFGPGSRTPLFSSPAIVMGLPKQQPRPAEQPPASPQPENKKP